MEVTMNQSLRLLLTSTALALLGIIPATAQQITGTPGSPSATTTIDGNYIPNPPPAFGGEINLNAKGSKPWWPPNIVPPKGAPNILLIMTDDQGYGISGTFGGVIPTPTMDRIAKMGLRYTEFHSTALCSPSRAAIITGRNHHSVGFGVIAEQATGYPGYDSIIGVDNATIGEVLKENGYATSWFGKNQIISTAPPDLLANGRPGWALTISTASWAGRRISGRHFCSATPRKSFRGVTTPATT
jgi:Sulfatase